MDPNTLFANKISGGLDALFKTIDAGAIWTVANRGLSSIQVDQMAVNPTNFNTFHVVSPLEAIRTTDNGSTWSLASYPDGDLIAVAPSNPNVIYTAGYANMV
jgi:photosystem II stability/assembly factor-like uncharacterized protein